MKELFLLFDGIHLEGGIPMALFYALFGFLFVFLGIVLLVVIFSVIGKLMNSLNQKKKKPTAPKTEPKEAEKPVEAEGVTPETVAVITAAIAAFLGEGQTCGFVVRRIKRL